MSKDSFRRILELIQDNLAGERDENSVNLQPIHKLGIFLQFLRTNSFHKSVGSQHHIRVAPSAVCKHINFVAKIVSRLVPKYVTFPDEEESKHIADEIFQASGFPGINGIIDGTHVGIVKPTTTDPKPEKFCNRKHFYSLNCVVICDHLKRVRFFTNRHCGSAHDSRIWEETHLKSRLATRFSPHQLQHLIGDEGFACSDTLLTIVREHQLNKITDPHKKEKCQAYNAALKKARISVEHCFGMIKKRFPALLYKLRCRKIENVQAIIASVFVLHNLLILFREQSQPQLPPNHTDEWYDEQVRLLDMGEIQQEGARSQGATFRVRDHIIENFF
jgi:hypothetical protein